MGKKTGTDSSTRFPQASCFKKMCDVYQKHGVHIQGTTLECKGMRKQDEKPDSHAAKKGAKKLVSSDFVKILE